MRGRAGSSLVFCLCLLLTACATIGPPKPPSLQLPKPSSDLRATRKGNKIILTWTAPSATTDRQNIRSLGVTRICRGTDPTLTSCGANVAEITPAKLTIVSKTSDQKSVVTYTDTLPSGLIVPEPLAQVTYAVEVLNASGRSAGLSNRVQVSAIPTIPPPELAARVSADGVILHWTGIPPETEGAALSHLYRIYRRQENGNEGMLVQEVKPGTTGIVDRNFEWEKTYYYWTTIVTVGRSQSPACANDSDPRTTATVNCKEVRIEGDNSPEVKVFTDDVFPPAVPSGLQAVFSGPGQQPFIDLIWAPVADMDLGGYYVYRREEGTVPVKLNTEPLKTPAYRDTRIIAGKKYLYSVSSVDTRGNESANSEEAEETVP